MTCTEKCWTIVSCTTHGNGMNPRGRSAPLSSYYCCEGYADYELNPRHLWDEHDSARWYTDPEGWTEHENNCNLCDPLRGE